jgi:hypothetical protein
MMIARHRLIARIALFSALVYALSWGTAFIPNVNLIFFLVFSAGFLWGLFPGVMVGGAALLCTVLYYLPVSLVDAWLFQPFWPRFYISLAWALPSLGANLVIFPLLFAYIHRLYERESLYN